MSEFNESVSYIDQILERIQVSLSITDYEKGMLKGIILDLMKPTPESSMAAQTVVNKLEEDRVWLINFLFMVTDKFNSLHDDYMRDYDKYFTRISKMDRPNRQAVDSEVHSTKPYLADKRQTIANFENFKSLLYSYLKSIEFARQSAFSKWQSGRYGD